MQPIHAYRYGHHGVVDRRFMCSKDGRVQGMFSGLIHLSCMTTAQRKEQKRDKRRAYPWGWISKRSSSFLPPGFCCWWTSYPQLKEWDYLELLLLVVEACQRDNRIRRLWKRTHSTKSLVVGQTEICHAADFLRSDRGFRQRTEWAGEKLVDLWMCIVHVKDLSLNTMLKNYMKESGC